jgi:CofD-related protein of GAK system
MSGSDNDNPRPVRYDPRRIERARQAPANGPAILFFSGGTALRPLSRELVHYSHNSVHVITTFDSGGSSAELRRAFGMPAVGDLRNRVLALADRSPDGDANVRRLAAHRFDLQAEIATLKAKLEHLGAGRDPLAAAIAPPARDAITTWFELFRQHMPADFDLRGASLGNLMLTGAWLQFDRRIEPAVQAVSRLVRARGTVLPVLDAHLDLAAELEDGSRLHGQRELTGKETAPIAAPVKKVWLTDDPARLEPAVTHISPGLETRIAEADLVCYPMGSFYSSVVANLLPGGVGRAVAKAPCPKVYVPNLGNDPESFGLGLAGAVRRLLAYLEADADAGTGPERLLDYVLIDSSRGAYPEPLGLGELDRLGVQVIDVPLVTSASAPLLDEKRLVEWLVSLS